MKTQDDLGTTDTTNKTADTSGRESPLCELPCYAIDGYSIAADGLQGRVKSPIVYGHDHHKQLPISSRVSRETEVDERRGF